MRLPSDVIARQAKTKCGGTDCKFFSRDVCSGCTVSCDFDATQGFISSSFDVGRGMAVASTVLQEEMTFLPQNCYLLF